MKKTYVKPQILFDSFELSQSIAAGCVKVVQIEWTKCVFDPGDGIDPLFSKGVIGCITIPAQGDEDAFCYDVPNPDDRIFSS